MKLALFYHSLLSDWNHGNAHFLRGVVSELLARGHQVEVYEPNDAWSLVNLLAECGEVALLDFVHYYPGLRSHRYDPARFAPEEVLAGADLAIVHEWNAPELVARIGRYRAGNEALRLLFHDTHHRAVSAPEEMARYDLRHYDGVLAFGEILRTIYLHRGWARRVWTWHEAADTRLFRPDPEASKMRDLVWIGNWGDGERNAELEEFLIEPAAELGLCADVFGVRYPRELQKRLRKSGIAYKGWLPNYKAPEVYAETRMTVHIPRGPYVRQMPGIATIRPFEALACAVPLVSAPWEDSERLFTEGKDYLLARDGAEMRCHLDRLREDEELAHSLAQHGLETIRARHTCAHRVDELLAVAAAL
ncbi:MAG TPA: glycosyltransferase [Chthoniobacteraceae bacterium]|nr:glycosyltransferase [Chthoniobacteraceae bacterium]